MDPTGFARSPVSYCPLTCCSSWVGLPTLGQMQCHGCNRKAIPSQLQTDRKHQNCAINDDSRAGSGSHLLLQGKQRQQAPLKWARNSHCGAVAAAAVRKTGALCLKELQQRHFPGIRLVTITVVLYIFKILSAIVIQMRRF